MFLYYNGMSDITFKESIFFPSFMAGTTLRCSSRWNHWNLEACKDMWTFVFFIFTYSRYHVEILEPLWNL